MQNFEKIQHKQRDYDSTDINRNKKRNKTQRGKSQKYNWND